MAERAPSPLAGKRVVVTRPLQSNSSLTEALRAREAEVILFPLIRIEPPQDLAALDAAVGALSEYDWLIFTSQNAVAAVTDRLAAFPGPSRRLPESVRVAVVGPATEEAAAEAGMRVSHTSRGRTASDLVSELAAELYGKRVLVPRSDRAAPELLANLSAVGAEVREVIAYHTVAVPYHRANFDAADAILFFSPSAVQAFRALVDSGVLSSELLAAAFGAIGPVTEAALLASGLRCDFQAVRPRSDEIITALAAHFATSKHLTSPGVTSQ